MLERRIQKFGDFRKRHDLIKLAPNLPPAHAENRSVQIDIFAAGELKMKSRADFKQTAHGPTNLRPARGRKGHA
jgi:hypothetical protein